MRKPIIFKGQSINPTTGEFEALTDAFVQPVRAMDEANRKAVAVEPIGLDDPIMSSAARHAWIENAAVWSTQWLRGHGVPVEASVRVSMGLPFRAKKATIGQCWHGGASADGHREVFISPVLSDGPTIVATIVHELIHAALPDGEGHGKLFKQAMKKAGLEGKATATVAGADLLDAIARFIATPGIGPYQAGALNPEASGQKKQTTRLHKAECPTCGYTIRGAAKWFAVGLPVCPTDGDTFTCDTIEPGEGPQPELPEGEGEE